MKLLFFAIFWILVSACVSTGTVNRHSENIYKTELHKIKARSEKADFSALRMSYTDTSAYKLYSDSEPKLVNPVLGALSINDCDRGLASASDLLDLNFVSLTGHYAAMACNLKLNMEETARYHQYILKGLMESIGNSGDGRSPESAYIVISASELKTFIQLIGLKIESQSLLSKNAKTFQVMRVSHPDTGDEFDMLFDVSIPAAKSFKYFE